MAAWTVLKHCQNMQLSFHLYYLSFAWPNLLKGLRFRPRVAIDVSTRRQQETSAAGDRQQQATRLDVYREA